MGYKPNHTEVSITARQLLCQISKPKVLETEFDQKANIVNKFEFEKSKFLEKNEHMKLLEQCKKYKKRDNNIDGIPDWTAIV